MAANNRRCIQPVLGVTSCKLNNRILDTAENLVENIDELADVMDKLTEKYNIESKLVEANEINGVHNNSADCHDYQISKIITHGMHPQEQQERSLFLKLKSCLDSTRQLISSLRKERGQLMKREFSVECRLGEIEDYKTHMKQDLTKSMEMVELLTARVFLLEKELAEEQKNTDDIMAEKESLKESLQKNECLCKELKEDNDVLRSEIERLLNEMTNTNIQLEIQELRHKSDSLVLENAKLKEMLPDKTNEFLSSDGDLGLFFSAVEEDNVCPLSSDTYHF